MILRARIGSQATTKGTHHFCVTGVGLQAHLVTCDLSFLLQNVETVNRVTSDQCPVVWAVFQLNLGAQEVFKQKNLQKSMAEKLETN